MNWGRLDPDLVLLQLAAQVAGGAHASSGPEWPEPTIVAQRSLEQAAELIRQWTNGLLC